MRSLAILLMMGVIFVVTSCVKGYTRQLSEAKAIVNERPDSAYMLLKGIEYVKLDSDKDRADYILTHAFANIYMRRSLMTDTLLPEASHLYTSPSPRDKA